MEYRKLIFSLLLIICLINGCTQKHSLILSYEKDQTIELPQDTAPEQVKQFTIGAQGPSDILTLRQALALTLINNPELKAYSLETRAAQARELQAGLRPNPELEVEMENAGGTGESRGFNSAETTIQLSQLIEIGNKSQKRKKVAAFEKDMADLDYQSKKLEILSDATKAFILVLNAQEKLVLSNELLGLSQETYQAVAKRVDAGKDSPVEKTRAAVALANVRISDQQARRNLEYARRRLASYWGQDTALFERAAGTLDSIEQLPHEEFLVNRLKSNPEYSRWAAEIKKSRAELELEKSKSVPDVTVSAGVQRFNETDDNAFVLGFSIPLPVSDRNQGAKQAAVFNLAKSRQQQKAALLKLGNEFNEIYREFANSYDQAVSLKDEVLPAASELFDKAAKAYQQGKVDYLNLLDAQRTFFDVKNQYVETLAAYHIAKTQIESFIGNEYIKTEQ